MVIQQNVKVITSLNEEFARGNGHWSAVYQYFPDEKDGNMQIGNNMYVKCVKDKTFQNQSMTIRTIQVVGLNKKIIHTLRHIHYHAWEDFSTPAKTAMDDLMNILQM